MQEGDLSSIILTHSLRVGKVIKRIITAKIQVQMGSIITQVGFIQSTTAEQTIPILDKISPTTCSKAALTFKSPFFYFFYSSRRNPFLST